MAGRFVQPGLARQATTKAAGEASGGCTQGDVQGDDVRAEQRLRRLRWRLQNGTKGTNFCLQSPSADKEVRPAEVCPRARAPARPTIVCARDSVTGRAVRDASRQHRPDCMWLMRPTTRTTSFCGTRTRPTAWRARLLTTRGRPSRAARRTCSAGLSLRRCVWSLRRRCACARGLPDATVTRCVPQALEATRFFSSEEASPRNDAEAGHQEEAGAGSASAQWTEDAGPDAAAPGSRPGGGIIEGRRMFAAPKLGYVSVKHAPVPHRRSGYRDSIDGRPGSLGAHDTPVFDSRPAHARPWRQTRAELAAFPPRPATVLGLARLPTQQAPAALGGWDRGLAQEGQPKLARKPGPPSNLSLQVRPRLGHGHSAARGTAVYYVS